MIVIKGLLFILIVLPLHSAEDNPKPLEIKENKLKYIFTIPKKLQSDENGTACFLSLNYKGTVTFNVAFFLGNILLSTTQRKSQGGMQDCFELKTPKVDKHLKDGEKFLTAQVDLQIEYGANRPKTVHYKDNVVIYKKMSNLIFLETDKAVYKPGDVVRIRILNLDAELKPLLANATIVPDVKIMDKNGYTIGIWQNVSAELGLAQLEHYLPEDCEEGKWKIEMGTERKTFDIKKTVLPRFQLITRYPKEIYTKAKRMKLKVCAKHSYGVSVRGNAYITVKAQGYQEEKPKFTINDVKELKDGCAMFTLPKEKIPVASTNVQKLKIEMSIVEFGSGHLESTTVAIPVTGLPYRVAFMPGAKPIPGLMFRGQLRLWKNYVDLKNITFDVCYREKGGSGTKRYCEPVKPEKDRTVTYHFLLRNDTREVTVSVENEDTSKSHTTDRNENHRVFTLINSVTDSYLYLEKYGKGKIQCYAKDVRILVHFTTNNLKIGDKITFYYMITSNDKILKANKIIRTISSIKNPKEMDYKMLKNFIKSDQDFVSNSTLRIEKFILKMNLTKIKIMGSLKILVYYVRKGQEIISDTIFLDANKCVENKVQVTWSEGQKYPGDSITLNLNASPYSLCAITSVDKAMMVQTPHPVYLNEKIFATHLYRPKETPQSIAQVRCIPDEDFNNQEALFGQYEVNSGHQANETERALSDEYSKQKRYKRRISDNRIQYQGRAIFQEFSAVLITNILDIEGQLCSSEYKRIDGEGNPSSYAAVDYANPDMETEESMLKLDDGEETADNYRVVNVDSSPASDGTDTDYYDEVDVTHTTRILFPETWIWDLVAVGKSGEANLKRDLPHSVTKWRTNIYCVSRTLGAQVAKETEVTAFQPFFLEILNPYSIKRGELLHLQVLLFNYLNYSVPVRLTLYESDGINLTGNAKEESEINCVERGDHITEIFKIKGTRLGRVELRVTAEIEESYPRECGPDFVVYRKDTIRKIINVESEGYPVKKYKTETLCTESFRNISNVTWYLQPPSEILVDTSKGKIVLNMDVMGPTIQNLDNLFEIPTGCGEQIMATMSLNVYALNYLNVTKNYQEKIFKKAVKNLKTGYQRILKYRHRDGSFSAFGEKVDKYGSTFLTAFVIRTLQKARRYVHVDDKLIQEAFRWIVRLQMENGCFFDTSHNFQFMGESGADNMNVDPQQYGVETPALAAYVMLSLLESNLTIPKGVRENVLYCLKPKGGSEGQVDAYTAAISTYALFSLGETSEAVYSLQKLMQMARNDEEDLLWWQGPNSASSVEITGYAMLSLLWQKPLDNLAYANSAVRWLNRQRNNEGGFVSTQDTVVALDALTRYGQILKKDQVDLTVRVNATNLREVYQLKQEDIFDRREVKLPVLPSPVSVQLEGVGCIIVQSVLEYNTILAEEYKTRNSSETEILTINAQVNANVQQLTEKCIITVTPCMTYRGNNWRTSMAILEINVPTGFEPRTDSLENMLEEAVVRIKDYEYSHNKITVYFGYLSRNETICISMDFMENARVEDRQNSNVHLYDYYNPNLSVWTSFNVPDCQKIDNQIVIQDKLIEIELEKNTTSIEKEEHLENSTLSTELIVIE